jgi:hypothetical protein
VLLHNTLIAGNVLKNSSGNKPVDVAYSLDSASDYNLIGDGRGGLSTANHNLLGSITSPLDPLLAALGSYGGTTQTLALLPASIAIDAGSGSYGGNTDQRGKPRVGATDIGAFESQGFTIAVSSGNNQKATADTAFAQPLVVSVTANDPVEPVAGGAITFTAPVSGASAVFSDNTISSDGKASVTATADGTTGTYTVIASATGIASTANFSLGNTASPSLIVTTLLDKNIPSGTNSLRQVIAYADSHLGTQTITFDPSILTKPTGNVIDLQSALPDLKGDITIEGPGVNGLTVQRDASAATFVVFMVDAGGTTTISNLTISGGSAEYGGGIHNDGTLTVSGSRLSGNTATYGGGIDNYGSLTVSNCTLSGNTAAGGGGIANYDGNLTVNNSTLSGNTGTWNSGGLLTWVNATLHNTLIAGNQGGDVGGRVVNGTSDYNLIGDGSGGLSTANHNLLGVNPLLAPLGNYGGPTQTMALLPGSPAIDAGSSAYGGSTDQRGKPRVGATDIGAFESQGFTLAVSSGNNQTATGGTAFANPLVVSVKANNAVEPVAGGALTFTTPASGASAVLSDTLAAVGSDGEASVTAAANTTAGTYRVSASASGVTSPVNFSLTNTPAPQSLVVTTLLDETNPSGTNSLRQAIYFAESLSGPQTITFDPSILTKQSGNVIDLQSALPDLIGNITIKGPGANVLTVQRDAKDAAFSVFTVDARATATISSLTIFGGSAAQGGGIDNLGTLTVSDCTLSGNQANDGLGGGINNTGSLTVSNSTLAGNAAGSGGGIYNQSSGAVILTNATLAENSASTVAGGIDVVSGDVLLHNTLIAGNLVGSNPSDVSGSLDSASNFNLIGDGSGGLSTAKHNLLGASANPLDPLLAPLGDYGGPTQTMALLPGSPAIDAGSSAYGGNTDQRGKPRVGATDIGAFESQGFTLTATSGNNQSAAGGTAFANPLVVTVKANNSVEPVAGGAITFTAPSSGASATFSANPATIDSNGKASVTATAHGAAGSYTVSASATGIASPANFFLTNSTAQPTYDAVSDFSIVANPNDVWSYLYEQNGSAPQLLETINPYNPTGINGWWDGNQMPYAVGIDKNTTGSTITSGTIVWPPNLLRMDPESYTAIVRWTAPSTGTWKISGLFQGDDTNTQDHPVEILENSTTVLLSATSLTSFGQQVPFSDKVTLNKGDTIDFIVLTGPTTEERTGFLCFVLYLRCSGDSWWLSS